MRRILLVVVGLFVVASAAAAQASSVHWKGGSTPTFTDNGLTLTGAGSIAGLGNGDVTVVVNADAQPIATCTNPSGANQPPGQNPAKFVANGSVNIPSTEIKNGNLSFRVTTVAPQTPIPGAPGCPNKNWTERIVDVVFTNPSLAISQGGAVVLRYP